MPGSVPLKELIPGLIISGRNVSKYLTCGVLYMAFLTLVTYTQFTFLILIEVASVSGMIL
jgi:hypothetical protein